MIEKIISEIAQLTIDEQVQAINDIKIKLHEISPFKNEPVDCVLWVKNDLVRANDYNPNHVSPKEMDLLKVSIDHDGFTQPIVSMQESDDFQVIDGFHRHRVGKEIPKITERVHGYLPLVQIRASQEDKSDRMASTIRHNRARGEHKVDSMAEIVIELKRRFWSDEKIAKELGMEADEVLRLTQVTGLALLFKDQEFSKAWEADTLRDVEGEDETDADL